MMQKPDVDHITGLSPAISIEQKTTSRNPRSTVGTVTEIYDYLRLLFARVGIPYSPATGLPIEAQQISQMVDIVMALPEGTRAYLLAPIVRDRKGEYRKEFAGPAQAGLPAREGERRVPRPRRRRRSSTRSTGTTSTSSSTDHRARRAGDAARELAADRARPGGRHRGARDGPVGGGDAAGVEPRRITFSEKFACPVSGFTIAEIEPRLFSFNAPYGACPACDGLGVELFFDPRLVVPDEGLSLMRGAIAPWAKGQSPYFRADDRGAGGALRFRQVEEVARPAGEGAAGAALRLGRREGEFRYDEGGRVYEIARPFEGVIPNLERRYRETDSAWVREEFERYRNDRPCGTCHGYRLKPEALAVKIAGNHVGEVVRSVDPRGAQLGRDGAGEPDRAEERDRALDPQGDPRAAGLPGERRASTT